jgi:hypothetical protein
MKYHSRALLVLFVCLTALPLTGAQPATQKARPSTATAPTAPRPRITIWIELAQDFDPAKPVVVVRYRCESAETTADIHLPKDDVPIQYFTQLLSANADGVKLSAEDPFAEEADVLFTRKVSLKPGESASIIAPLFKMYSVPEKWKVLEIVPMRGRIPGWGYTGSVRIVNESGQSPSTSAATTKP